MEDSKIEMNIHMVNSWALDPRYYNYKRFSLYYDNKYIFKSFNINCTLKLCSDSKFLFDDRVCTLRKGVEIKNCSNILVAVQDRFLTFLKISEKGYTILDSSDNSLKLNKAEVLGIELKDLRGFLLKGTGFHIETDDVKEFKKYTWNYSGNHSIITEKIDFKNDNESEEFLKSDSLMFPVRRPFLLTLAQKYFVERGWFQNPKPEATIDKKYTINLITIKDQGKASLVDTITVFAEPKIKADTKNNTPVINSKNNTPVINPKNNTPVINSKNNTPVLEQKDIKRREKKLKKGKKIKAKKGKVEGEDTTTEPQQSGIGKSSGKTIAILVGSIFGGLLILTLVIFLIFKGGSSNKTREIV